MWNMKQEALCIAFKYLCNRSGCCPVDQEAACGRAGLGGFCLTRGLRPGEDLSDVWLEWHCMLFGSLFVVLHMGGVSRGGTMIFAHCPGLWLQQVRCLKVVCVGQVSSMASSTRGVAVCRLCPLLSRRMTNLLAMARKSDSSVF